MVLKCRCHGISGSCELKTCWRTLPSFSLIGQVLKEKYDNAVQVTIKNKRKRVSGNGRRRISRPQSDVINTRSMNRRGSDTMYHEDINRNVNTNFRSRDVNNNNNLISKSRRKSNNYPMIDASKRELVYISRSVNYCIEDKSKGILGTSGRTCTKDTNPDHGGSSDSCYLLCCGRGYNTMIKKVTTRCDCKFEWCCNVTCNVCENETEIYTCK